VQAALEGRRIETIGRSGKYLAWELSGDLHLLVHLRMTGSLLLNPTAEPSHTRVRFELDAGRRLVYVDPRRFGTGHVLPSAAARDAYLGQRIGIEPLTPEFTLAHLRAMARGRRAPVKSFVLDQRRIAGIGNIYADEALFRAQIHPLRPAGSLSRSQLSALRDAIEEALLAGIEAKGATIDDFRHVDGARGSFQDRSWSTAARRALPALRNHDHEAGGGGPGNLRVRALPGEARRPRVRAERGAQTGSSALTPAHEPKVAQKCPPRPRFLFFSPIPWCRRSRRGLASGGQQVGQPPGPVGRQQLIEAAERSRRRSRSAEGEHPVSLESLARPSGSFARLTSW